MILVPAGVIGLAYSRPTPMHAVKRYRILGVLKVWLMGWLMGWLMDLGRASWQGKSQ
jgi:hypothetical protein